MGLSDSLPGLPGSSTDLFLRACPQSPRKVRRVLAHYFPTDIRLHPIWRTGHLHWCHEAESGSLALRLAGLLPRFPPAGLRRLAPDRLHARTSNLHGEFLSIHKISQACLVYQMNTDSRRMFKVLAYLCSSVPKGSSKTA